MSRIETESVLASIELLQELSRVKFLCSSQVMTVGSNSRYGCPGKKNSRNRANLFIAAEIDESETGSDIYYGRLVSVLTVRLMRDVPNGNAMR